MKKEQVGALVELGNDSADMNDYAKRGCELGLFVSRAQGRRMFINRNFIRDRLKKGGSDAQDAGHQ